MTEPTAELKEVVVDVVSEMMCPFGWVGKRKLEMAIAKSPDCVVTVNWRPYFCRPNLPREGISLAECQSVTPEKIAHCAQAAKSVGIDLITNPTRLANTVYAQCLLAHTLNTHGWKVQNELMEKLYYAFFTEGKYPDIDMLVSVVQQMDGPIDPVEVRRLLESGELEQAVLDEAAVHSGNMPGVPSFFFNGTQGCSGAQEASTFMQMLHDA